MLASCPLARTPRWTMNQEAQGWSALTRLTSQPFLSFQDRDYRYKYIVNPFWLNKFKCQAYVTRVRLSRTLKGKSCNSTSHLLVNWSSGSCACLVFCIWNLKFVVTILPELKCKTSSRIQESETRLYFEMTKNLCDFKSVINQPSLPMSSTLKIILLIIPMLLTPFLQWTGHVMEYRIPHVLQKCVWRCDVSFFISLEKYVISTRQWSQ